MDLKTLDTVIAMIMVLLVLSLIVQSIQSLIKKWFRLKSKSILVSLNDLFDYVGSNEIINHPPAAVVEAIKNEFKKLGRVSLLKKAPMVDSIAKEDLLKILDKIELKDLADEKVAELKGQVNKWFDTVMQSFEERYTRHMKTVSIIISIVVVILLNANFFDIYRNISTNDVVRASLIDQREAVEARLKQAGTQSPLTEEQLKMEIERLKKLLDETSAFGFTPLTGGEVKNFFRAQGAWSGTSEWQRFLYFLELIGGWAIMIMLLSVGAPFWQDALESLFGIKNLLRKKSDTQNVEDVGGQPKP
jgi:hypothetical protein